MVQNKVASKLHLINFTTRFFLLYPYSVEKKNLIMGLKSCVGNIGTLFQDSILDKCV